MYAPGILACFCSSVLIDFFQGLLLLGILEGAEPNGTFSQDATSSRTKIYLTFILSFTAITNIIVSGDLTSVSQTPNDIAYSQRFTGSFIYLITRFILG